MNKKKNNSNNSVKLFVLWFLVVIICGFGAFFAAKYYKDMHKDSSPAQVSIKPINKILPKKEVEIFVPKAKAEGFYLEKKIIKAVDSKDQITNSVNALINQDEANRIFPKGTKLISDIKIRKDIAKVDFNRAFLENFEGGAEDEAIIVNSLAHTIVNADGSIKKIRILVEGKTVESLGGHLDLTEPIEADPQILKAGK